MAGNKPTLFPPLEPLTTTILSSKSSRSDLMSLSQEEDLPDGGDDVLPPVLARNFETLRFLLAEPSDDDTKTAMKREIGDAVNSAVPEVVKRRKAAEDLAIETALAVEREVSLLQNGIVELEALLEASAHRNEEPRVVSSHRRNRFPSLPLVVPNEDDDHEAVNKGEVNTFSIHG